MIIKSMSRKEASFGQLIDYIDRDEGEEKYRVRYNVFGREGEQITREFEENATLMRTRKNGVYLYHEIISLTRSSKIDLDEQKACLREIVEEYIALRAPNNLCYGNVHDDMDHSIHYHLMISANRAGQSQKQRLTKAQFRTIQTSLEAYVLERYPQLEQKVAMNKRAREKLTQNGSELKRRTGETPKRDRVRDVLENIFQDVLSDKELFERLHTEGFALYSRGKTFGVVEADSGRKFRLKTLGVLSSYENCMERLAAPEHAEKAQSQTKQEGPKGEEKKPDEKKETLSEREQEALLRQQEMKQARADNPESKSQSRDKDG